MKRIVQFILLATFATLFSCSKNTDIQDLDNQLSRVTNKDIAALRISPDIVNLSISDAENVALLSIFTIRQRQKVLQPGKLKIYCQLQAKTVILLLML